MSNRFKKPSTSNPTVKTLYILTLTAKKMPAETLRPIVHIAEGMLKGKDTTFARLMREQMLPDTKIEIANIKYAGPLIHTPQTMQLTLAGWIKRQYNVDFGPEVGKNFFPHGMRNSQGKENFFLFYFDMNAPHSV